MKSILIYGGSFDPPHHGHLQTALNVQHYFHFDEFIFLPCKIPVLKAPTKAQPAHRMNMLRLMLQDYPQFSISPLEIDRDTPSYMVDTLKSIRNKTKEITSITLLVGIDALRNLPQWHQFQQLPDLCNLLVIDRPQSERNEKSSSSQDDSVLWEILNQRFKIQRQDERNILKSPHGQLVLFDAGQYPFSSTEIRQKIKNQQDINQDLPKAVYDYIKHHALYS